MPPATWSLICCQDVHTITPCPPWTARQGANLTPAHLSEDPEGGAIERVLMQYLHLSPNLQISSLRGADYWPRLSGYTQVHPPKLGVLQNWAELGPVQTSAILMEDSSQSSSLQLHCASHSSEHPILHLRWTSLWWVKACLTLVEFDLQAACVWGRLTYMC